MSGSNRPELDQSHTGAKGESFFANHFIEQRIYIAQPLYDLWGSDFVVEWEGDLRRVNVKTMIWDGGKNKGYKVNTSRTCKSNESGRRLYSDTEISYFGVVNLYYKRIWMLPLEATTRRTGLLYKGPMEKRHFITKRAFDWDRYRIK